MDRVFAEEIGSICEEWASSIKTLALHHEASNSVRKEQQGVELVVSYNFTACTVVSVV